MAEAAFVIKVFFLSCVFVLALQYKVEGQSAEQRIFSFLQDSRVSGWLKDVGQGAVRMTASTYTKMTDPQAAKAARREEEAIKKQLEQESEQKMVEKVDRMLENPAAAVGEYPTEYAQ